jgi:hypothetical protein
MSDQDTKDPKLVEPADLGEVPADEMADEDERALRALRLDLPGRGIVPPDGIVSLSVGKPPRREFFRTHPENRAVFPIVDHEQGLDKHFYVVAPNMIAELASIGIDVLPHALYQIVTTEGAIRLVPVRQADKEGGQNEWSRSKEIGLVKGVDHWVRFISDQVNGRYRVFPAPVGRFPDPVWPDLTLAKIIRLAFSDRGHLIDSPHHPLFQKWAARDGDTND